jgi:hypothetical protein
MKMIPTPSIISAIALTMPLVSTNIANAQTAVPTPTVYYSFDDLTAGTTLATNTAITDSSGNAYNGGIKERPLNVTADGLSGNGLTNFTATWYGNDIDNASQVRVNMAQYALLEDKFYSRSIPVTISMWIKNPGATPPSKTVTGDGTPTTLEGRLVLFGVTAGTSDGGYNVINPWEVWLDKPDPETGLRTINITWQSWNNILTTYTSEAFEWDSSAWYNVVLQYSLTDNNYEMNYSLYLTKQGDEFGEPILSGVTSSSQSVGNGNCVFFGGQGVSYNKQVATGGSLGAGAIIDECAIWATAEGALLTQEQLAANFAKFAAVPVPEPAATVAFVGFLALVTVSLFRHRR